MKARKYVLTISSIVPSDAKDVFELLSLKHGTHYIGIYNCEGEVCIYVHMKNVIDHIKLKKFFIALDMDVKNISVCKIFTGEMVSEHGKKFINGGARERKKRKSPDQSIQNIQNINSNNSTNITNNNTNNNINLILVNPIGMESLDHITPEFIQNLLAEHHGPDVVFKFGTKMYSLQENMNFKTDIKSGFISGRLEQDGAWETHRKSQGFSMLLDNLKDKNEQAVLKYLADIPEEDFEKFKLDMGWIREHKWSGLQEDVPVYERFIRDGFNLLTANIADKKRRIERDTGKKMKLV